MYMYMYTDIWILLIHVHLQTDSHADRWIDRKTCRTQTDMQAHKDAQKHVHVYVDMYREREI